MRKLNFALYIVLFLVLMSAMGMVNIVIARFDPDFWKDGTFWLLTITTSLSYFMAFVLAALSSRDVLILKDQDYGRTIADIDEIKQKGVDADFPEFIASYNRSNKIDVHLDLVRFKLSNHTYRVPRNVIGELNLDRKSIKTMKWIEARDRLKEQLTKEWIDTNIDYHRVTYPLVTVTEVLTGIEQLENKKRLIDERVGTHIFKDRILYVLANVVSNSFFAALVFDGDIWTSEDTLRLLIQISGLVMNVVAGLMYGIKLFGKLDKNNAQTRKTILLQYLRWKKR